MPTRGLIKRRKNSLDCSVFGHRLADIVTWNRKQRKNLYRRCKRNDDFDSLSLIKEEVALNRSRHEAKMSRITDTVVFGHQVRSIVSVEFGGRRRSRLYRKLKSRGHNHVYMGLRELVDERCRTGRIGSMLRIRPAIEDGFSSLSVGTGNMEIDWEDARRYKAMKNGSSASTAIDLDAELENFMGASLKHQLLDEELNMWFQQDLDCVDVID